MGDIIRLEVSEITAKIEVPVIPVEIQENNVPVVVAQGKQGPAGRDGAVIGGAVINDSVTSSNSVWSSQHTHDQDVAVVDSLEPDIDLVLLFNNALA